MTYLPPVNNRKLDAKVRRDLLATGEVLGRGIDITMDERNLFRKLGVTQATPGRNIRESFVALIGMIQDQQHRPQPFTGYCSGSRKPLNGKMLKEPDYKAVLDHVERDLYDAYYVVGHPERRKRYVEALANGHHGESAKNYALARSESLPAIGKTGAERKESWHRGHRSKKNFIAANKRIIGLASNPLCSAELRPMHSTYPQPDPRTEPSHRLGPDGKLPEPPEELQRMFHGSMGVVEPPERPPSARTRARMRSEANLKLADPDLLKRAMSLPPMPTPPRLPKLAKSSAVEALLEPWESRTIDFFAPKKHLDRMEFDRTFPHHKEPVQHRPGAEAVVESEAVDFDPYADFVPPLDIQPLAAAAAGESEVILSPSAADRDYDDPRLSISTTAEIKQHDFGGTRV
jgi:hypothetical protein